MIGSAVAGIIAAGAAVGRDELVVVGLLVFFALGLSWLVIDALIARRDDATESFVRNLRRGHYDLGTHARPALRVAAVFTELADAI